jgi:hypothetical protein
MDSLHDRDQDRRDFLRNLGRCVALGGMTVLGGYLALKRARAIEAGTCINQGVCGRCPISHGCRLPEAQSYRQEQWEAGRSETDEQRSV